LWQLVFILFDEIVGHELAFAFDGHQSSLFEVVAPSTKDRARLLRYLQSNRNTISHLVDRFFPAWVTIVSHPSATSYGVSLSELAN